MRHAAIDLSVNKPWFRHVRPLWWRGREAGHAALPEVFCAGQARRRCADRVRVTCGIWRYERESSARRRGPAPTEPTTQGAAEPLAKVCSLACWPANSGSPRWPGTSTRRMFDATSREAVNLPVTTDAAGAIPAGRCWGPTARQEDVSARAIARATERVDKQQQTPKIGEPSSYQ